MVVYQLADECGVVSVLRRQPRRKFGGRKLSVIRAENRLREAVRAAGGDVSGWGRKTIVEDLGGGVTRKRHKVTRKRVSLGLGTYLGAAVGRFEGATVIDLVKNPAHRYKTEPPKGSEGKKRGVICGFSAKSRKRMMKVLAECPRGMACLFVTLTVPWDLEPERMKKCLQNLWGRLKRKYGEGISAVWKMEPHKRQGEAWHFHLLMYGIRYLPHQILKSMWAGVIGSQGHKGAYHRGVEIKWIKEGDATGVRNYVAKYMVKEDDGDCGWTGRMWGVYGDLPRGERVEEDLRVRELVWLWRLISRRLKKNVVKMSCEFFCEYPERWIEAARCCAGG